MNAAGTETALWMSNLNLGAEPLTVSQLDNTNTHLASGVSAISSSTFGSWLQTSGNTDETAPKLIPANFSNSYNVPDADTYGNKYGTLYNYAAASAGTYVYPEGSTSFGDATSDLCPSGWRMPTGGNSTSELYKLVIDGYNVYDINNAQWNTNGFVIIQQDLGFPLAGGFIGSVSPSGPGYGGNYWSRSAHNTGGGWNMSSLVFTDDFFSAALGSTYRGVGFSVRCIAQ